MMFLDEKGARELVDLMMQENGELEDRIIAMLRGGAVLVNQTRIGNTFRAYRFAGGIVQFYYDSNTPLSAGNNIIGTLPLGFRPYSSGAWPTSTGSPYDCRLSILEDGIVSVYNYSGGTAANVLSSGLYVTTNAAPSTAVVESDSEHTDL